MLNRQFVMHLSLLDGIGPATVQSIMNTKKSDMDVSDFYSFSLRDWMRECGLTERIAQKIVVGLQDTKIIDDELRRIEKNNIKYVALCDDDYPSLLREIHMPPSVLYWKGGDFDHSERSLSIVGSRKTSTYGQRIITGLVPGLVEQGWVIVSGGALGADTMAHETTIKAGGKTIVVLGSGLLCPYPSSNNGLFRAVVESGGLVISSFSLTTSAKPGNFPARNRIIAGLSRGCLVVQAAQKSGALITAQFALEQGREVFAIPGPIDDELSAGCHTLIQNGAKLVTSVDDIMYEFGGPVVLHKNHTDRVVPRDVQQQHIPIDDGCTEIQKKIMNACKTPASCDDIVYATQLPLSQVQVELFDLHITGKVEQDFSGMWSITGL